MKIGIISNKSRDKDYKGLIDIAQHLQDKGIEVSLVSECPPLTEVKVVGYTEMFSYCDFVFILGGDGTILNTIKHTENFDATIYGINFGNLGYLTDAGRNDYIECIDKLLSGDYYTENRMTITLHYNGDKYTALNDIYIKTGVYTTLCDFEVAINEMLFDSFRADGCLVCTPTGSTAYNLSLGGPIVKADTELISMTPIASHSLYTRPIIFSSSDSLKIGASFDQDVYLYCDGNMICRLESGDTMKVVKGESSLKIARTKTYNFYEVLREKSKKEKRLSII